MLSLLVGEQVGEQEQVVPARLVVRDLAVFQELDQGRAADAEEVGGLLGGQPLGVGTRVMTLPSRMASTTSTRTR